MALKLIFAGTPDFAATCLRAIHAAGHEVMLVLTQPDRPSGRGQRTTASAVAGTAIEMGLRVEKPESIRALATLKMIEAIRADVMIVVAYGKILPVEVLGLPRRGCLNIHASLLPRWRGAAPIQRAIEAGDAETGVSIMQMDAGLDTGPVLFESRLNILPSDTSATLFDRLAGLASVTIVKALSNLDALEPRPQPLEGITYAEKIAKSEAHINWSLPASALERRVRALDPFPGCDADFDGSRLKVWEAKVVRHASEGKPGQILEMGEDGILVKCGADSLRLTVLQRPGGRRIQAKELFAATKFEVGRSFG